ncbi:MAG TPA: HigA family addiction module antitoxin [Gammaproteobacteria bacterium]|nr:HigA family addiction module antitoxin [Gammaproteobacteria bacterium]
MSIYNPLHPGEIVAEILINGAKLSVTQAAERLDINRATLSRLINGHAGISSEMALRLSKLLPNTDMVLWMNLQRDYDIWLAKKRSNKIHIKPLKAA